MSAKPSNTQLALGLVLAIFFWGGTNTATKFIVGVWPPVLTGASRMLGAGGVLLAILHWTRWLGEPRPVDAELRRRLWWRGGAGLAAYMIVFNWALRLAPVSHIALYLGAAPVWALFWEGIPVWNWRTFQRYGAAILALTGVFVLFRPALKTAGSNWAGDALGLAASILWTNYGRDCRALGAHLTGAQVSGHTMWRAGVLLLPIVTVEFWRSGLSLRADLAPLQGFCILAGGVAAFALWNNALRWWSTSKVLLFNNLIPLCTMSWARVCLGEPITPTFWLAMLLVASGVILGQTDCRNLAARGVRESP